MNKIRGATSGAVSQLGFSLIELMIVIAIIGILSAIVTPNILNYRDNYRLRAAASDMLATFRKAQVAAVKRNYNTGLIFDTTAGTATVYLDNGAGGGVANDATKDAGEPILEVYTVPVGCDMPAVAFLDNTKIGFTPRGLPVGSNIGSVEVHSISASAKAQYKISLSLAGHTDLKVSTDGGSNWD